MGKILKVGRVVILLGGRFAGRKAVVVRVFDDGTTGHNYGCALVAGINKAPQKVTRSMGKKTIAKRSTVKPFLKIVNFTHLLPTRLTLDAELGKVVPKEAAKDLKQKNKAKAAIKKEFEARYKTGKSKWFFTKLRF